MAGIAKNSIFEGLTEQQETFIFALISQPTIIEAAEKAGVPHRTVYGWFRSERFKRAYDAFRRHLRDAAMSDVAAGLKEAANQLRKEVKEGDSSAARIAASKALWDISTNVSLEELDERVSDLERKDVDGSGDQEAGGSAGEPESRSAANGQLKAIPGPTEGVRGLDGDSSLGEATPSD